MSDAPERQTQPIAIVVRPGIARVSVVAGKTSVGGTVDIANRTVIFGGSDADVDLSSDPSVADEQARFENDNGAVTLEDLGEQPNVFVRRKGQTTLQKGQPFLVGNQRLRIVDVDEKGPFTWKDGTQLFTSPVRTATFAVQHILEGGRIGASATSSDDDIAIGAADSNLVLGHSDAVSVAHATVRKQGEDYVIEDKDALNGVFTPLEGKESLESGALFWIGNELLRLDITG